MRKQMATVASFLVGLCVIVVLGGESGPPPAPVAQKVEIKAGSALDKLIKEVEDHSASKAVATRKAAAIAANAPKSRVDIPDWLRAHYLRNHPEVRVAEMRLAVVAGPPDPTEGLPLALENLYAWMLLHQELQPSPATALKAAAAVNIGTDARISGGNEKPNSESDIRINPGNPKQIIAASNNIGGSRQAHFFSSDGGASWGQTTLPLLPGDSVHSDPTVDWTTDGTAWATTIGINAGSTALEMRSYRSSDGGQNWIFDATFSGSQRSADKQMMCVDRSATSPFKDNIYVIWHNNNPAFVNRRIPSGPHAGWDEPKQVSQSETVGTAIGSDITTNSTGDVFAVWPDTVTKKMFLAKSVDGGGHYSPPVQVAQSKAAFDIGVPAFAERRVLVYVSIAAFHDATLNDVYVSWTDLAEDGCDEPGEDADSNCKTRVWFKRSTDGGTTWSKPAQQISPSDKKLDQFNQRLVVDPKTGNLGIVYYETGEGLNRKKTDIYFQASVDHGVNWTKAKKVTSAQTDETIVNADLGNQYGDYNGLSVVDGVFFPCWTDRRDNKVEAIFTARITLTTNAAGAVEAVLAAGPTAASLPTEKKKQ